MADVSYMHVCDYAFLGEGGKPCIIGVFEFIQGPTLPIQHPLMYVAVAIKGAPHENFQFTINIDAPDGKQFARIDAHANLAEGGLAFIPMRLPNVVFPTIGVYTLKAVAGQRELAQTSLHIRQMPAEAPPQRPN